MLVGVSAYNEKISDILMQGLCNKVPIRLEGDKLAFGFTAFAAA